MSRTIRRSVLTVVGARPQFVKAAAVSRHLADSSIVNEVIVHTGQHFDDTMSDVFFRELNIPSPQFRLDIHSLPHGAMTGRMVEAIERLLLAERVSAVMVYGDTNSTLAGALAARKLNIPVLHVEAGLRSFRMDMPEEVNRVLVDRVSSVLCCPTDRAVRNLEDEGFSSFPCTIVKTGDVMRDAALFFAEKAAQSSRIIDALALRDQPFAVATVHRADNTDSAVRLAGILRGLEAVGTILPVIVPLHPRTVKALDGLWPSGRVRLIEPLGYLDMVQLLAHSSLVLTDSGGLQKEAFFFSKPCVTLRDETEWTELVEAGFNWLVGTDERRILEASIEALSARLDFSRSLFGSGSAGLAVASCLEALVGG